MATIDYTEYTTERTIAKVSVPKLYPGTPISNVQTGGYTTATDDSQILVVEGIQGQTATTENFVADGYKLRIKSPVDSTGAAPDVLIGFSVGSTKLEDLQITGTYQLNMFPSADRLVGGYESEVLIGYPMLNALLLLHDAHAGRISADKVPANLPLKVTGIKLGLNTILYITVISKAGWGQAGAAIQPLTVELKGHVLNKDVVSQFSEDYASAGDFSILREPFLGISGTHALSGPLSAENWMGLPNGTLQTGPTTITRALVDAINLNPIDASNPRYVYSNKQAVGGSPNSVSLLSNNSLRNQADLGDPASTTDAFVWDEFGVAFDPSQIVPGANPQVYVGMRIANNQTIPGNESGRLISLRENPLQWGQAYPQEAASNRFLRMAPSARFGGVLSWGVGVAPQASTLGLTTLPAGALHYLKGGRRVTGQLNAF